MNTDEVRSALRSACAAAGSRRKFALAHGLSPAYVGDVINGNRTPGVSILEALGLRREQGEPRFVPTAEAAQ